MKYKLVIFDLDGTILDTLDDLHNSVNFALKSNSLPERSKEEVRAFVGNGIRLLIERAVPDNTSDTLTDSVFFDFKEHYKIHSCDNTKPYEGIIGMLQKLRVAGLKTAVVSNKADFAVRNLVQQYFVGLFDFAVGECENVEKKPAPDSVINVIKHFDMNLSDVVYVGDSEVDIMTALNANIDSIIVDWGFRDKEFLLNNKAEFVVSSVNNLTDVLIRK